MTTELKHKKILVIEEVEDDTLLRNALNAKLVLEGFGVLAASNGEEGLATALQEHPDLILIDIVLPGMDGITMMQKLRDSGEWGKNVPIILLTNLSADDQRINQAVVDHAPAYYLIKSNSKTSDLVEKIKERLSHSY